MTDAERAEAMEQISETTKLIHETQTARNISDALTKIEADNGEPLENIEMNVHAAARSIKASPCACCSHCCVLF